jgi:Raf kinase inhibitor-like YbhB/YbcL family protein
MAFQLTSLAFQQGGAIPKKHTGEGRNVSPPLKWSDPPEGTRTFALICEDPDAPRGTFTHWVIFNLPAKARELTEGTPTEAALPDGAGQEKNDFGKVGYGGPMPPPGKPHRYFFTLYALDQKLDVQPGATRAQVVAAMKGHILSEAQLMGTYGR